eukprot:TRINITY_DN4368_c0_g2_i2.p1 TRINITY_DN4368_c0_g2~~TRINITY_DN4368_c0_g2_i2.p1  ORF type:complete len:373 (-),score=70.02 TRINITY_DN4368_c0_g2_i2:1223-2341(-)
MYNIVYPHLNKQKYRMYLESIVHTNKAVSGTQTSLNEVAEHSTVVDLSKSVKNEATIDGVFGQGQPTAVAGIQTLARNVSESTIFAAGVAAHNTADNLFKGKAVAGVDRAVDNLEDSKLVTKNVAYDNHANSENGRSVAGSQQNVRTVDNSEVKLGSKSSQNTAIAEDGNAIAGVDNNLGDVVNGSKVKTSDFSKDNQARAENGKAISGVAVNALQVENSHLGSKAVTHDNRAIASGASEDQKYAVAGFSSNIKEVEDSTVDFHLHSEGNTAKNYHYDEDTNSHAVAGNQIVIGNAENSDIHIEADAHNNYAYAVYGNATSGNNVLVLNSDADTTISHDLDSSGNVAYSVMGSSYTENNVVVGGDATTIGNK